MGLLEIMERFPNQQACLDFLEGIRFKEVAYCPHCASAHVGRKGEKEHIGRWNCFDCYTSFRGTHGTVFHRTKIELQKWFLAIILMLNAKKSLNSHQLARDLNLNQKTAWFMMTRIRAEMDTKNSHILKGVVEADETYIGGKARGKYEESRKEWTPKEPVVGAVERDGNVVARHIEKVTKSNILEFLVRHVKFDKSTLMTDEHTVYKGTNHMHQFHKNELLTIICCVVFGVNVIFISACLLIFAVFD